MPDHDTLFILKLEMTAQKRATLGLNQAERIYKIPCAGPVNLNHPVFHAVRQIMINDGITFEQQGPAEVPIGYHESWWTVPFPSHQ